MLHPSTHTLIDSNQGMKNERVYESLKARLPQVILSGEENLIVSSLSLAEGFWWIKENSDDDGILMGFRSSPILSGPSSVQYQHGAPSLFQGQSGSPPPTGMPRMSLPTNQQAASARPTVPLAPGVPQQQQVTSKIQ